LAAHGVAGVDDVVSRSPGWIGPFSAETFTGTIPTTATATSPATPGDAPFVGPQKAGAGGVDTHHPAVVGPAALFYPARPVEADHQHVARLVAGRVAGGRQRLSKSDPAT